MVAHAVELVKLTSYLRLDGLSPWGHSARRLAAFPSCLGRARSYKWTRRKFIRATQQTQPFDLSRFGGIESNVRSNKQVPLFNHEETDIEEGHRPPSH